MFKLARCQYPPVKSTTWRKKHETLTSSDGPGCRYGRNRGNRSGSAWDGNCRWAATPAAAKAINDATLATCATSADTTNSVSMKHSVRSQ
jgi:hypothetical protein